MNIKGTAVKSTPQFVKDRFKDNYTRWLQNLPAESQKIMQNPINVGDWYPLTESVIMPTETIGKLFFKDNKEAAFEIGRYSAEVALKGVYKVFIMVATPAFMISRATKIFSTYYDPAEINLMENSSGGAKIEIKKFKERDAIIAFRITGWVYKALELMNKKNIQYKIDSDFRTGGEMMLINLYWE